MRQAQLIEHGEIYDSAIGMYHSTAEAFVDATLTQQISERENLSIDDAAASVEREARHLSEAQRGMGEVIGIARPVSLIGQGFPTPPGRRWTLSGSNV